MIKYEIKVNGDTLAVEPKQDITPIEAYNLVQWEKFFERRVSSVTDEDLYQLAIENGIDRHFIEQS